MKVTYERLICARNIIKTYYESMCDELGYSDDKDTLNDELSIIDELIEQHNTPTWEDVVALSLKNNFDCWYEEEQNRVVFGDVLPEFFVYKEKVVSAVPHTNNYFKNYDLFNVARRYLESQKEKENE